MKKNDCSCEEQREPIIVNPHVEAEANEVIFDLEIKTKIDDGVFEDTIIYSRDVVPTNLKKINETPVMNEKTIFSEILKLHKLPEGKFGLLKVISGKVNFAWEEELNVIYTVDFEHSLGILPNKPHRVILNGPVELKIEFYE
ncbi:DUF1971 domain-containing protein [Cetobacterium sp.]|uniref:DUF1971 domain-containing protein n=1 Tax=Cetobacterium sp. TaxID=2071632 RepID=UPI003F2F2E7A